MKNNNQKNESKMRYDTGILVLFHKNENSNQLIEDEGDEQVSPVDTRRPSIPQRS